MRLIPYFLLLCIAFSSQGSSEILSGIVVDGETSEALPFATLAVAGKTRGTVSNLEGKFVLDRRLFGTGDSLKVTYMGYQTLTLDPASLTSPCEIRLSKSTLNLDEIYVYSEDLTAEDILELVRENYDQNHPNLNMKQKMFLHKYERVPFNAAEQIHVKRSDFQELDKGKLEQFLGMIPSEFVEYHDIILDHYKVEEEQKIIPIEAISMEEGSQQDLFKEMEKMMGGFFEDVLETNKDDDVYYRFRTGIFAGKFANGEEMDSTDMESSDSSYYSVGAGTVKYELNHALNKFADIDSKNWEFITKPGRYKYTLEDLTNYGDEIVYPISFLPKGKGLFEGKMYISASTYAVLQLDFQFASGKRDEHIQLLGFGHDMNFKKGQVIFEKTVQGYFPKYIYAQQEESASIERTFVIKKKKKRFLIDKELNEMKFDTELEFDISSYWELLIMNREEITNEVFAEIEQPEKIKFTKQLVYSADMWESGTVIAPTAELSEYKRVKK